MRVMTESDTLDAALAGRSLARFGDGEFRVALGKGCISQEASSALAEELRAILAGRAGRVLPCIPRMHEGMGNREVWLDYQKQKYKELCTADTYGSAFITRPDSAPNIDTPSYWDKVRSLWRDKDVILVAGDEKSLTEKRLLTWGARNVTVVQGPSKSAYAEIDRIEEEVGHPGCPILLCLGACATVLAARLARSGEHAIDLGHIGMFMKRAGAYGIPHDHLLSKRYKKLIRQYHEHNKWGTGGWKEAGEVFLFYQELGAQSILDYGCGKGTLAYCMRPIRVQEYDPGIPGKDGMPKGAGLVVCADVLEHVEESCLDAVLRHIWLLADKGIYLCIALYPDGKTFPDGKDLHITLRDAKWWRRRLEKNGYVIDRHTVGDEKGKDTLRVWVKK